MTLLAKAIRLGPADRALLLQVAALHTAIALLIRIAPFGWVLRRLASVAVSRRLHRSVSTMSSVAEISQERRIVWAVRTIAALFPVGSTCLTTALTAHVLLARRGCDSTIRFGVAPAAASPTSSPTSMTAHAWVERGTRIVMGGETRDRYRALDPLETSASAIAARMANSTPLAGIRRPTSHTL
jgi:hypothetical protein